MNFQKIGIREYYEAVLSFSIEDVDNFAKVSSDYNPLHMDQEFAKAHGFENRIVHGALVISKVSGIIASKFPGPGTIIGTIEWKFLSPVLIHQELKLKFTLDKSATRKCLLELNVLDDSKNLIQEARMVIFLPR
jgi:3-hydroxybutyryl-CoA dehydratase